MTAKIVALIALSLSVAACSSDEVKNSAASTMRGWCQANPDRCTVTHSQNPRTPEPQNPTLP